MALRMMHVCVPERSVEAVARLLTDVELLGAWPDTERHRLLLHILLPAEATEAVMDRLEDRYEGMDGFRIVLFPVEAVLPRVAPEPEPPLPPAASSASTVRISREELYQKVTEGIGLDRSFLPLAALSAIVAAVGLIRDDVAVIIGAMVIAPLLGPNVALSLATALGDAALARRALITNLTGVAIALALSVMIGLLVDIDVTVSEIQGRTHVDVGHLVLALGAGAAGTLAYTRGLSGAVIGVMVAVALMPPLVTAGMLFGEGHGREAVGALALTFANVIGINLAGTLTFLVQGVGPRPWWDADRARRATQRALAMCVAALATVGGILLVAQR